MAAGSAADHVASAGRMQLMLVLLLLPPSLWNGITHIPSLNQSGNNPHRHTQGNVSDGVVASSVINHHKSWSETKHLNCHIIYTVRSSGCRHPLLTLLLCSKNNFFEE